MLEAIDVFVGAIAQGNAQHQAFAFSNTESRADALRGAYADVWGHSVEAKPSADDIHEHPTKPEVWTVTVLRSVIEVGPRCPVCGATLVFERFHRMLNSPYNSVNRFLLIYCIILFFLYFLYHLSLNIV